MFFHGYRGSAADEMDNAGLRQAFSDLGILLVVADAGPSGTWNVANRRDGRDNLAYTQAVLSDVRRRWPVDEAHVWASGFSEGAFMVWNLACNSRGEFSAYVALSGAFIEPLPAECPGGPVNLLSFHGLTDEVVPIEGRKVGPFVQGDLFQSFAVLRRIDGCRRNPDTFAVRGPFVVRAWDKSCGSGKRIAMAIHRGGHEMLDGWVELAWDWIRNLPVAPGAD
jgi:polyhydroxybutyrate depolymerase